MGNQWMQVRNIIKEYGKEPSLFLSLITPEGLIEHANLRMLKTFHLGDPRKAKINFFELIHPSGRYSFQSALKECNTHGHIYNTELSLKNGHYHSMKWQINQVSEEGDTTPRYLCIGYQLPDKPKQPKPSWPGLNQYREIMDGQSEGVILQDKKGSIVSINRAAAALLDIPYPETIKTARAFWNLLPVQSGEKGLAPVFETSPLYDAQISGRISTAVISMYTSANGRKLIKLISQPLFDTEAGKGYAVVTTIADVTADSQVNNAADDSIRKAGTASDFIRDTPNLAWLVDENEHIVTASQAFYTYFNLDEQITAKRRITELLPATISGPMFGRHTKVLRSGVPVTTTEKIVWASGKRIDFHINIFPVKGPAGKCLVGGYAISVGDNRTAEKQLREANERLLMVSKATSDAIWEWDMKSEIILRNDSLMEMIGYQEDEPRRLWWWIRRIHPDDRRRLSERIKESIAEKKQSWQDEYRFKCADGSYRYMRDRGFILYENELPVRMIGSLQDMTDIRNLQAELSEEKMAHQKSISETVIKVQEKERTRIGHELHDNVNQILSTAKLFIDQLHVSKTAEKQFKQKSVDYLLLAIDEIRKLSKELVTPQLREKTLVESLGNMIDDIRLSANIDIKYTYCNNTDLLSNGKKLTLFRIAQEQLKNIQKYSEATRVDILLTEKDNMVQLLIKDNGVGFDITKPVKGIGLMNIQERARFYNGEVKIDTAPGQGCQLQVILSLL